MGEQPSMGENPSEYGDGPAGGGAGQPAGTTAGLGARIGARLLDVLIVGIPASIILIPLFSLGATTAGVITSLLWFGYFVILESTQGATVGKKVLSLRVVGPDGGLPSTEVAAKRNVWMLLGILPFIGGLLSLIAVIVIIVTISQSPENRGYHDTFAGTFVLK